MNKNILSLGFKKINSRYSFINGGGCGIFAVELWERFQSLGIGIEPHIWIFSHGTSDKENFSRIKTEIEALGDKPLLGDYNERGWYLAHVVVEFGGAWFDSTGVYGDFEKLFRFWRCKNVFEIDYNTMSKLAKSESGWSDLFNRTQIASIRQDLDEIFKKVV